MHVIPSVLMIPRPALGVTRNRVLPGGGREGAAPFAASNIPQILHVTLSTGTSVLDSPGAMDCGFEKDYLHLAEPPLRQPAAVSGARRQLPLTLSRKSRRARLNTQPQGPASTPDTEQKLLNAPLDASRRTSDPSPPRDTTRRDTTRL